MPDWTPCPETCRHHHDLDSLRRHWDRLHTGDQEAWPLDPDLQEGWRRYHNGDFQAAAHAGLALGTAGTALANKATSIHAVYVEPSESLRVERLLQVVERARQQQQVSPELPSAWYWHGYALGRYCQGISVVRALAQNLGSQVRTSLETALRLAPRHTDAHLALAHYHAEVIDKVGALIAGLVHGAHKDTARHLYDQALALEPGSAIVLHEVAEGWLMLDHDAMANANGLRERAAGIAPLDAMECLYRDAVLAGSGD